MQPRLSIFRALLAVTVLTAAGVLLAACGGSGPSQTTTGSNADAIKFASCMRSNGVPGFPDPSQGGSQIQSQSSNGKSSISVDGTQLNVSAPAFQAAQQKCQKDAPQGPPVTAALLQQARQHALTMAKCMRSHGITNFPDPVVKAGPGGHGLEMQVGVANSAGRLDPQSPEFQTAQKACAPLARVGAKAG